MFVRPFEPVTASCRVLCRRGRQLPGRHVDAVRFLVILLGVAVTWAAKRAHGRVAGSNEEPLRRGRLVTKERDLDSIASLWRAHPLDEASRDAPVRDRTRRDLSMAAVFARIDRCAT